jgi:hypothetical protein
LRIKKDEKEGQEKLKMGQYAFEAGCKLKEIEKEWKENKYRVEKKEREIERLKEEIRRLEKEVCEEERKDDDRWKGINNTIIEHIETFPYLLSSHMVSNEGGMNISPFVKYKYSHEDNENDDNYDDDNNDDDGKPKFHTNIRISPYQVDLNNIQKNNINTTRSTHQQLSHTSLQPHFSPSFSLPSKLDEELKLATETYY